MTNVRNVLITVLGILSLWCMAGAPLDRSRTQVQSQSDVSVQLAASSETVKAGETLTYTVTASNLGPADATFIDVAVSIPDQLTIVSVTCDAGISPDGPFCEYSDLQAGARAVSIFVVTPSASVTRGSRMLKVGATVMFENPDPVDTNSINNAAWVKTKLVGNPSHP